MEFKYKNKQNEQQHEEDDNKLGVRLLQTKLECKFYELNCQQIKLYYQKQALIKLNTLFVPLYEQNQHNPYLDFIYKFLDKNDTIFNFKKDFLLSLLLAVDNRLIKICFKNLIENIQHINVVISKINHTTKNENFKLGY